MTCDVKRPSFIDESNDALLRIKASHRPLREALTSRFGDDDESIKEWLDRFDRALGTTRAHCIMNGQFASVLKSLEREKPQQDN